MGGREIRQRGGREGGRMVGKWKGEMSCKEAGGR